MPCGSTSAINQHSRAVHRASRPWMVWKGWSWKNPACVAAAMGLGWNRRRQYRESSRLDDHLLADIGVRGWSCRGAKVFCTSLSARQTIDRPRIQGDFVGPITINSQRTSRRVFPRGRRCSVRPRQERHDLQLNA